MTVLIDSWAWIEYWKGSKYGQNASKYIDSEEEVFVSAINITEIYSWFSRNYDQDIAKGRIEIIEKRCFIVPLEKELAISAAKLKLKYKLGIADSIVLATGGQINGKVVTGDPDFENIEGVVFIGDKRNK